MFFNHLRIIGRKKIFIRDVADKIAKFFQTFYNIEAIQRLMADLVLTYTQNLIGKNIN